MIFNLLGGSYKQRFLAANSQRTINWYPVVAGQAEDNKSKIALYPTPGLTTYVTLPGRYFRGFITAHTHGFTKCFAVVDRTLYEVTTNATYTTIGTLSAMEQGSNRLYMECNLQNEIFIGGRTASYVYDMDTAALTQITDQFFPNNIDDATYLDQYGVVCSGGAVYESLTTSFLNWSGTQTYSPTFKAAPVLAVGASKEQIFNFTSETIEVYDNDGTSPYSRLPRTSILVGIKAKDSLATFKDGFVFLGASKNGETEVYFYDGWNSPQPISDTSIAQQINSGVSLEESFGYVQQTKDGQYWYYLTIPSLNTTYCYSFKAGQWFNRQSTKPFYNSDGTQDQGVFRGSFHESFNGMNLFADFYSGKIFKEDYSVKTEDSNYIYRERTGQEIWDEDKNISHSKFVLDCNVGEGSGTLFLYWSDDGGYRFNDPIEVSLGTQGDYTWRVMLYNLGTSRKRVYKMVCTDAVALMLQNAYIESIVNSH